MDRSKLEAKHATRAKSGKTRLDQGIGFASDWLKQQRAYSDWLSRARVAEVVEPVTRGLSSLFWTSSFEISQKSHHNLEFLGTLLLYFASVQKEFVTLLFSESSELYPITGMQHSSKTTNQNFEVVIIREIAFNTFY